MKTLFALVLMFVGLVKVYSQDVECFVITPPEKVLENVSKISVMDFNGDKGRQISEHIASELLNQNRGIRAVGGGLFSSAKEGKTYQKGARANVFFLVERTQLQKVLNEQNLSNTGLIDDSQAAKIGQIMGIDAMITGSVTYTYKDEQDKYQSKDKNGNIRYSYCTTRKVTTEVSMKIIDVNTGQVLGNKISKKVTSDQKCDENRSGIASVSELVNYALQSNAVDLVNYFNPYFVLTKYKFEKIRVKEFKDRAREAEDYLKNNDFNNAFAIYKAIYDADPYNASSALNLGNLYHIIGNFQKAKEYWSIAAEIDSKEYQPLVQRADKDLLLAEYIKKYGIVIEETNFETKSDALAVKATTRGRKSDRYDVFAEPKSPSGIVAKVPGDTEFTVIENIGDWVLIKLLGGKQGYISIKDVRMN